MSKILVIGGHGFIGSSVVKTLKKTTHEVVALSRIDGFDLMDYHSASLSLRCNKPDVIINCVANVGSVHYVIDHTADVLNDNTQMMLNLYRMILEICPDIRIVNPLANCAYPGKYGILSEDILFNGDVHDSVYSYGHFKRFLYVLSRCYHDQYGIDTVNFMLPNTFGAGDSPDPNKTHALNGMIIRMLRAHYNGDKEFEIWGSGKPVREWTYVQDVSNILIKGIDIKGNLLYPINVAQNKGYTIKESARLIAKAIGYEGELVFNTNYQDGTPHKILTDTRFRATFPDYEFYNHEDGIKETVEYYKAIL